MISFKPYVIVQDSKCKAPKHIQDALQRCVESAKVLTGVWYERATCKSVSVTQQIDLGIFSIWSAMEHNRDPAFIYVDIQKILNMRIETAIRVPKNSTDEVKNSVIAARSSIVSNLTQIMDYYKAQM